MTAPASWPQAYVTQPPAAPWALVWLVTLLLQTVSSGAAVLSFVEDTSNFANPERGFAPSIDPPWPSSVTWDICGTGNNFTAYDYTAWTPPLDTNMLRQWREQAMSVVLVRYHIAEFRETPLSDSFLARLRSDFDAARRCGFKVVPRFTYNWPRGGPDAPLSIVLTHLQQLAQVFQQHFDVIAFMELGFIGCWGEMHTSSNNLISPPRDINSSTRSILEAAFSALPVERMIAVRYPVAKFEYFGGGSYVPISPLTQSEAYGGSIKARWGQHDDCLVCGEWNAGTWWSPRNNADEIRAYLAADNRFVVQSGEPGDPGTNDATSDEDRDGYVLGQHESCARCTQIMQDEHWSVCNASYSSNFNSTAYVRWKQEGCYATIAKRLGYRYRLTGATVPESAHAGAVMSISLTMRNDGWARPYNPRRAEVILRPVGGSGPSYHFAATTQDVRLWLPGPGESRKLTVALTLGDTVLPGDYRVLLNLPDPAPRLAANPLFSIRLANLHAWEPLTGYNDLGAVVRIAGSGVATRRSPAPVRGAAQSAARFDIHGRCVVTTAARAAAGLYARLGSRNRSSYHWIVLMESAP